MAPFLIVALILAGSTLATVVSARQQSNRLDLSEDAGYLAQFAVEPTGRGLASLRVASVTVAGGRSSITFTVVGTTVLSVQAGRLMLIADRTIKGTERSGDGTTGSYLPEIVPTVPSDGSGGGIPVVDGFPPGSPLHFYGLANREGAILESGARIRFAAPEGESVELLMVSVVPDESERT